MSWIIPKLAMREISRRKGQSVLIIIGLMVSTAVITGSLVAGDSMEQLVYLSTYENLGDVDQIVQASEFFDYRYYNVINNNNDVQRNIDKSAPVILIPSALKAIDSNLRDNNPQLFGIDHHIASIGKFTHKSDGKNLDIDDLKLGKNEIIINELLADKIEVKENEKVWLIIANPAYKINTVYSSSKGLNSIEKKMTVRYIVEHAGLGRLQLDGRTHDTTNIFMNMTQLQNLLGIKNKINTILISNKGDKYSGIDNDDKAANAIKKCLDNEIGYKRVGFELNLTDTTYLRVNNNKDVFFDETIYNLVADPNIGYEQDFIASPVLTYFVNSIELIELNRTNKIINYSIVSGLDFAKDENFGEFKVIEGVDTDKPNLANDEMILIDWAADQLGAKVGDKVKVEYMVLDRFYNIFNLTHEFSIKYIVSLTGKAADKYLMPSFPGLVGKLDCVNWEPSFPVDLNRITRPDRDFWFVNSGTPKAYISLTQAKALWSTNLGTLTMIKLNTTTTSDIDLLKLKDIIGAHLNSSLGHSDAEFSIIQVKSDSLATAAGMSIFPMMFLTFSSAIIIAGMALIITIFLIIAEYRKSEFGIERAIGLQKGQVIKLYFTEGLVYSLFAGILGIIFGIFIGWGIVFALNSIWSTAVQGYSIPVYFKPISLLIGFLAGFIISLLTIYFTARHIANKNIVSSIYGVPEPTHTSSRNRFLIGGVIFLGGFISLILGLIHYINPELFYFEDGQYYFWLFGPVLLLFGSSILNTNHSSNKLIRKHAMTIGSFSMIIYIIIYSLMVMPQQNVPTMELFFIIGMMLVFSFILFIITNLDNMAKFLIRISGRRATAQPVARYALQNPTRHLGRTAQTITIFTLVIFLLAALSINIAIQKASVDVVSYEERGGYDIIGETTVPISIDLENSDQRLKNNIDDQIFNNVTVTEIKLVGPPGGSCSNMNARYPPRLLGVSSEFLSENAFRFIESRSGSKDHRKTWNELDKSSEENDGRIPIAVDYNTLVWIYNGAIGEVYQVEDESGKEVKLEVIGVLENTVFGGTFVMSSDNLEELYPNSAEFRYVLFRLKSGVKSTPESVAQDLERALDNYGLDAQSIRELIRENREYERSFMVLFQTFLSLGLLLGMIGLGIITARSVQERRVEIGILRALGFTRRMVLKSFLIELSFVALFAIFIGFIIGIISSYLAFGSWTGGIYEFVVPWYDLILIFSFVYLITIFSALYPAYRASKLAPAEALRKVG